MEQVLKNRRNRKRLLILLALNLIFVMGYLFIGITEKNIDFYLPKRIMKVLVVLIVSYGIGYSSISFQTITNNRILTPSVMGLDSLYLLIQTIIVFFFGSRKLALMTGYPNFILSVAIMMGAAFLLFLLLFKGEGKNIYFLVLTGMIMGGLFGGLATFMQVLLDPNEFTVLEGRMFASFNNVNSELIGISLGIVFLIIVLTRRDMAYLDVLSLGVDNAISLGINYKSFVLKNLIIVAILTSVSTALVGPITFLGILVVNLIRQIINTYSHRELTLGVTLLGILFLTLGLFITERLLQFQTTVSVIINLIGGIYFIYLILKESKK
jgi:iron complex transport system permease protein